MTWLCLSLAYQGCTWGFSFPLAPRVCACCRSSREVWRVVKFTQTSMKCVRQFLTFDPFQRRDQPLAGCWVLGQFSKRVFCWVACGVAASHTTNTSTSTNAQGSGGGVLRFVRPPQPGRNKSPPRVQWKFQRKKIPNNKLGIFFLAKTGRRQGKQ